MPLLFVLVLISQAAQTPETSLRIGTMQQTDAHDACPRGAVDLTISYTVASAHQHTTLCEDMSRNEDPRDSTHPAMPARKTGR